MRMHYCKTQSCSDSSVHNIASGNKQLLAQVGAHSCSKEGTVTGRGLGSGTVVLPLPELLSLLTCRADDGTMVVHTRAVGVSTGWRDYRPQVFCRATPGVKLPHSQGEANSQQQQSGD